MVGRVTDPENCQCKLAWGASLLYRITEAPEYRDLAERVADFILSIQDESGAWFVDQPPYVSYDQSAECGIWLRTISAELAAAAEPDFADSRGRERLSV